MTRYTENQGRFERSGIACQCADYLLAIGIGLTLALAEWAGADVVRDPRNIDFGKIKVGNTRVDITGGHQGYVVNAYRILKKESVSSTTGKVTELEGGFGNRSRVSVAADFFKNKLAPVARYGVGYGENESFGGGEFDPLKEAGKSFVPIGVAGTIEAYKQGGAVPAAVTGGLGGIGFGAQTYGGDEKGKKKSSNSGSIYRTSGNSKSIYGSGGGSGKSIYRP